MPSVFALVPARGGSKGVPRKNARPLAGIPLIAHTIRAARAATRVARVVVSTDDDEIAAIAAREGAEVPWLRPREIAADATPMRDVVAHFLEAIEPQPRPDDVVVLLQPTAPLRTPLDIDSALALLAPGVDSVVSVSLVPAHFHPAWQLQRDEHGHLRRFDGSSLANVATRRQDLPPTYWRNGAIYGFWRRTFDASGNIYGERTRAYAMPPERSVNIDGPEDWNAAERALREVVA